ncbi:hypothetical protein Taro_050449 [Colocasia esculenta]|uniref:Uncharacterized protein n=1 Tax=Colocasia esculenta TaxID=4460 RepID=A0A843XE63_COLES|nr:hypothetical protein [Colocasia esculenta]
MKSGNREEIGVVESNPEIELFEVVVQKNSKLRLDVEHLMEKLESWTNRIQLCLEDESPSLWTEG